MGKVERVRPRPPDGQDGAEDRGGIKISRVDGDPRAPSPGNTGQHNKAAAPQDYQVKPDVRHTSHAPFTARRRVSVLTRLLSRGAAGLPLPAERSA